jgi:dTDP-4-dehydrorhamnose reductase
MKILLLGKNGMLGSQFDKKLGILMKSDGSWKSGSGSGKPKSNLELFSFGHEGLDVTKESELKKVFRDVLPDIVINCTGYTNVDESEFQKAEALLLNTEVPKILSRLCNQRGAIFIHFSTDYVFDGRKKVPDGYFENDVPNPLNYYGETKYQGEEFIQKEMVDYFIIRTSWLYGPRVGGKGRNFVDTMIKLGNEVLQGKRESLSVVSDQIGSPTYTCDLADAIIDEFILKFPYKLPKFGIYHLTNSKFCSWYEFAAKIFEITGKKIPINKIPSVKYPTPAIRPKNSILLNTKLPKLRDYDEALKDYILLQ